MATAGSTEDRLIAIAVTTATAAGFRIGDGAMASIRYQANFAAAALARGEGPGEAVAEANFRRLIEAMIEVREEVYGIEAATRDDIGERTYMLVTTARRFCPLWPFCS